MLFDTNVLIHLEDPKELTPELQELRKLIITHGHQICVHASTFEDVGRDSNDARRTVLLSKLKGYPTISSQQPDQAFEAKVGPASSPNEAVDDTILFGLLKKKVDFLVTGDKGIFKKAVLLGLEDRVLSIQSALSFFERLHALVLPRTDLLETKLVSELNIDDAFFDSLKLEYGFAFIEWFDKISREGRESWCYVQPDGRLKALMITKKEIEVVVAEPPLPKAKRLKICTLKVEINGLKLGEHFLHIAFDFCVKNGIYEVYLTHFEEADDPLVRLIQEFGFERRGFNNVESRRTPGKREQVFLKCFQASGPEIQALAPFDFAKKFGPAFKDGETVGKFVVPIRPEFHDRLFPQYLKKQKRLTSYLPTSFGNAIKKAYLCHSPIRQLRPGAILIFYRSEDEKAIGSLGVVERAEVFKNTDEIVRFVGTRTVYSEPEIREMAKSEVLAILFRHHFDFLCRLSLAELVEKKILLAAPQSITEISQERYKLLKKEVRIDEHLAVP